MGTLNVIDVIKKSKEHTPNVIINNPTNSISVIVEES